MSAAEDVRAFNRFYTRAIGVLGSGLHATRWSLAEARVIFELAQRGEGDVADVRRDLGLDAGYLSRLLGRLEEAGLVEREPSTIDRRRQVARLTEDGRAAFADLDARAAAQAAELLAPLDDEHRDRLVDAMQTIRTTLGDPGPRAADLTIRAADRPGDLGWMVEAHGRVYAAEFGWDATFEALVARIAADFLDRRGSVRDRGWIAEVGDRRAGGVLLMDDGERTARLRLLLVEPWARGLGLGSRLVSECVRFAPRADYAEIVLWTNDVLTAARRVYEAHGFQLVAEEPHRSFGHDLVGQTWRLDVL